MFNLYTEYIIRLQSTMADDKKTAFVASEELDERLRRLQKELDLPSTAQVLSLAVSMLEVSLGHEVEIKSAKKRYKISRFSKYNQTIDLDGSSD